MTENSAGLLVGIMEGGSLFNVTIDNCSISMSNERHVGSGNKFYVYTGGVVGKMTGGTINYVTIKNSKIYGRSFKPSPNGGKVCGCCGGIVGKVDNTSGTAIMIQNSKFLDNYIHCSVANEEAGSGAIALGGIVGYMAASSGSVTVSNCKVEIANQTSHSSANKDNGFYCYKTYDSNVSGRYGSIVGWKESGTVYDNNTSNVVYYYRSYSKKTDVRENLSLIG